MRGDEPRPAALRAIGENPFYVLGLKPQASRAEIEREGQKLLGMLELGLAAARRYQSPCGPRPRDADRVRWALAELRDPTRRLRHELWARLPATEVPPAPEDTGARDAPVFADALEALGFGRSARE